MSSASFRDLTASERALLDALLAHDFPGAEKLRTQVAAAQVRPGCSCGCGTVEFRSRIEEPLAAEAVELPVDLEGVFLGTDGSPVGRLLLFVKGGRLSSLEIYAVAGEPLPLPNREQVEWMIVPRS